MSFSVNRKVKMLGTADQKMEGTVQERKKPWWLWWRRRQ